VKKLGVRFDGAKRDYGQSSRRFVIPDSPIARSTHVSLPFTLLFGKQFSEELRLPQRNAAAAGYSAAKFG
jgi:hypothetical protein